MAIKSTRLNASVDGIVDLTGGVDTTPHVFLGIKFLDSSNNPVTPTSGTYTITASPVGMDNYFNIVSGIDIDATIPADNLSYAGNIDAIKYTPNGVTDADVIEIIAIGNKG